MSELVWLAVALAGGVALGTFYFGGLWLTVREMQSTQMSGLLPVVSFMGRAGVAIAAFYVLAAGELLRLLMAFLGFLLARTVLVVRQRDSDSDEAPMRRQDGCQDHSGAALVRRWRG